MNLRKCKANELDQLVELWYQVSLRAHDFIPAEYWYNAKKDMMEKYMPMAETYVLDEDDEIVGFVSMVDNYLAAIFISLEWQGKGCGKNLLNYIKEIRDEISLKVFVKNKKACQFYLKNGFQIKEELVDEDLNEAEYVMVWNK